MSKFYGPVGFANTEETSPGVWTDVVTIRNYSGDVLQNRMSWQSADKENDDLQIRNKISILTDPYAYQHFHSIKFVDWMGARWKVTSVEVQYPRLILDVGGLYTETDKGVE